MPFTMNGVGTSVCSSRGDIGWGSSDAMECFVVFFLPIVPYRAMHTFDWNGEQYRHIPIQWSLDLAVRTFVKPWSWAAIIAGVVLAVIGFVESGKNTSMTLALLAAGVAFVAFGVLGLVALHLTDQRNKAIRRVLGGVTIGNCDPANLTGELRENLTGNTQTLYGTATYADAVEKLLKKGSYAQAMWAARMTVLVEDPNEGEALTNLILADPDVAAAVEVVRTKPVQWADVMLSADERATAAEPADVEVVDEEPKERDRRPRKPTRRDDEDY